MFVVLLFPVYQTAAQSAPADLYRLRHDLQQPIENTNPFQQDRSPVMGKKSPATAVLYSLLIPGLGEWYVDRFDQGKYSLIAEGSLWLTYYSFQRYGQWIQDDARNFAMTHSGALISGKNDQFFVDVGNFNDTYEYNEKKLIDRTPERLYDVNNGYYWKWDSESKRREFRGMRVSSEKIFNNSKFVIGAVIVNHIISAINAARLARQYNMHDEGDLGSWWFESAITNSGAKPDGIKLSILRRL